MGLIDYFLVWTAIAFLISPIGASAAEHVHLDSIAEQGAQGRAKLLGTSFAQYERAYVNPQPGFFFGTNGKPAPRDVLRNQPHGRIAFANTDLAGASDHRNSIREADRAVKQLVGI